MNVRKAIKAIMPFVPRISNELRLIRNAKAHQDHAVALSDAVRMFTPNGPMPGNSMLELTACSIAQTFPNIQRLLAGDRATDQTTAEAFCRDLDAADELAMLFRKHGSDKATRHNYALVYATLLSDRMGVSDVFEFGLGTNNIDTPSHMGEEGTPGASLRAFRDYLLNANVYGADVDRRVLFSDDRIETFYVDQTDLDTFESLPSGPFDLVIDDGLHAPNANLATLIYALPRLKSGGWCAIEDVRDEARPIWETVGQLLSAEYAATLIQTTAALMFVVQKQEAH